jgi:hypothetical protein
VAGVAEHARPGVFGGAGFHGGEAGDGGLGPEGAGGWEVGEGLGAEAEAWGFEDGDVWRGWRSAEHGESVMQWLVVSG